jgi:formiminotetrahydrofolate cyclodeaminase
MPARHPLRERRLDEARSHAADVPLEAAEASATIAELAAEAARVGNEHLTGDAITGALLAEAGCRAAARLVEINLAGRADARQARVTEAVRRAGAAREDALRAGEEVMR